MFDSFFGGKPWYKSLVGWAMFVFLMAETAVPALSGMGVISPELAGSLASWMEKATVMLGTIGIRRRLPSGL